MKFVEYTIQSLEPQILVLLEKSHFDPAASNSNFSSSFFNGRKKRENKKSKATNWGELKIETHFSKAN